MAVVVTDPYMGSVDGARLVEIDELLATADAVSLYAPPTPDTAPDYTVS